MGGANSVPPIYKYLTYHLIVIDYKVLEKIKLTTSLATTN